MRSVVKLAAALYRRRTRPVEAIPSTGGVIPLPPPDIPPSSYGKDVASSFVFVEFRQDEDRMPPGTF